MTILSRPASKNRIALGIEAIQHVPARLWPHRWFMLTAVAAIPIDAGLVTGQRLRSITP